MPLNGRRPAVLLRVDEPAVTRGWAPLRGLISGGHKYIDLPLPELYNLAPIRAKRRTWCRRSRIARRSSSTCSRVQRGAAVTGGGRDARNDRAPALARLHRRRARLPSATATPRRTIRSGSSSSSRCSSGPPGRRPRANRGSRRLVSCGHQPPQRYGGRLSQAGARAVADRAGRQTRSRHWNSPSQMA